MLHPPRGVAASGFPPLCNIPHCCLPQESGPCLSSSVADHPLRPATRHRLGKPLPHQLADTPQPYPTAVRRPFPSRVYAVLAHLSVCYPPLWGKQLRVTHPSAGRQHQNQSSDLLPLDLHVLSMPPAFTLSQDQTLHKSNNSYAFITEVFNLDF